MSLNQLLFKNFQAFSAIPAHVNVFSSAQYCLTEIRIFLRLPNFAKRLRRGIAHLILRMFVETTRDDTVVPRNGGCVPEKPAVIREVRFDVVLPVSTTLIATEVLVVRHELIALLRVIDLSRLDRYVIDPHFLPELLYVFNLVFVVGKHDELQHDIRIPLAEFFLPFDKPLCPVNDFREPSPNAVFLKHLLCRSVHGDDYFGESSFDRPTAVFIRKEVSVGAYLAEEMLR